MTNLEVLETLDNVMEDISVSDALVLTNYARREWMFSGSIKLNIAINQMRREEGHDMSDVKELEQTLLTMDGIMDTLEGKGYVIVDWNGRGNYDACASDKGELITKSDKLLNAASIINFTPDADMPQSEVEFSIWGWNYLLNRGQVSGYYGPSPFGSNFELFHLLRCGLNGNKSTMARIDQWEEFNSTFDENDIRTPVFRAFITCRCGEVEHLDVGDDSISTHDRFLPQMLRDISRAKNLLRRWSKSDTYA